MPARLSVIYGAVVATATALSISACGGSTKTVVQTVTQAPVTVTPTTTGGSTARTVTAPAPAPPRGNVDEAAATVEREGFDVIDRRAYDKSATLRVLLGIKHGSGDGYAKRAFFFVRGRYIGTDTSDLSASMRVASQSDTTVGLTYALYGPRDALCCPHRFATVRYHWDGTRLVPLDRIPSRAERG
jgi:LppP/LprE lipoprotein